MQRHHPEPSVITETQALSAFCSRLSKAPFITVDTEFLRETTYYPLLCVAQIASIEEAVVIDTLAPDLDLATFFALMNNQQVLKVFHAARQDIEIVWNMAGKIPHPIFDSQVAAMVSVMMDAPHQHLRILAQDLRLAMRLVRRDVVHVWHRHRLVLAGLATNFDNDPADRLDALSPDDEEGRRWDRFVTMGP